jgi:hypothetical protein
LAEAVVVAGAALAKYASAVGELGHLLQGATTTDLAHDRSRYLEDPPEAIARYGGCSH